MKISGSGNHVIGTTDDGKHIIIDNSAVGFGTVSLDPAIWELAEWHVPFIKRVWNRFGPVMIECPPGTAPNGMPYRTDEFFTYAPLLAPMSDIGLHLIDGRMWTSGDPWNKFSDHRTVQTSSYQMTRTDRNGVLKCTPTVAGGNQLIVLPPPTVITGTQLDDSAASYLGCHFWIKNGDPPSSSLKVTIYPSSGSNLDSLSGSPGLILDASVGAHLYMSGDGTKVLDKSASGI